MTAATGFVFHELYLWHDTGAAACEVRPGLTVQPDRHIENPEGKRRIRNLLEVSGILDSLVAVKPHQAELAELKRVHSADYIDKIRRLSDSGGGNAGEDTSFGAGGFEIASLAAGGAIAAAKKIAQGDIINAYALLRPPGHHALPSRGMGFCIFNNIAIAACHLRESLGIDRIAVVDWDVHHGNGTQEIFYKDADTLTISLHQRDNFPPKSGNENEIGEGKGKGANINIPLSPGCGHGAYLYAFSEIIIPAIMRFKPEFIFVASGLDAGAMDPLGRMMCVADTYRQMTRMLMSVAADSCEGRILMCHEGGYFPPFVPYCALAIIEELSGIRTGIADPFSEYGQMSGQELQPHQRELIGELKQRFNL